VEDEKGPEEFRVRHVATVALQSSLLETKTVGDFLQAVADGAATHVGPHAGCSVTTLRGGVYECAGSSSDEVLKADLVEYQTRSGPCVEAASAGVELVVPDLRSERRWPEWTAESLRLGFRSAAAVPADTGDGVQMALDLYSTDEDAFGEPEMRRARVYAEEAARTLRLCLALAERATLAEQLQTALTSRAVIDQALGVIMGQSRVSSERAFEILSAASQHRNVKLREIAKQLIESLTGHPPADPKQPSSPPGPGGPPGADAPRRG
jgi:hypothetical protein